MSSGNIEPLQLVEAQTPIDLPAEPAASNPVEAGLLRGYTSKNPCNVPVADGLLASPAQPSAGRRIPSRKRKAPTKRDGDWEPVKRRIIELHSTKTLPYIMTDVKQSYGFTARLVWRSSDHFAMLAQVRVVKDSSSLKSRNGG